MTATKYMGQEQVILVDDQDQEIGVAEKLEAHQKNLLHRAFSVFIYRQIQRANGIEVEILLQQRALNKYHSPGLWTNTCCSHPRPGESVIAGGERRLQEELGLAATLREVGWFQYNAHFSNGLSEHEIDHVLIGMLPEDGQIRPNSAEVHAVRWVTVQDLEQELAAHPKQFTPWLKAALALTIGYI